MGVREILFGHAGWRAQFCSLYSGRTSIQLSKKVKTACSAHLTGISPKMGTSLKGGVGKTNLSCHLCPALQ